MTGLRRAALALSLALAPAGALSATPVDVELVLALDVSGSIDEVEIEMQRKGFARALTEPDVLRAIRSGPLGRIAVTVFEWASADQQRTLVGWTLVHDEASARAFADAVLAQPVKRGRWTSISGAIAFALARFQGSGFTASRRIIDLSGDGANNEGGPVTAARDRAVAHGVTVNGLAIMNVRGERFGGGESQPGLDNYYEDCVVGGPGAFVIVAETFDDFAAAARRKLLQEIAAAPRHRRAHPALPIDLYLPARSQVRPPCDVGEREHELYLRQLRKN